MERERRRDVRYTTSLAVWAEEISSTGTLASGTMIRGTTRNISDGGLCVGWDRIPAPSAFLKCWICVTDSSVAIPTLAQVRWVGEGQSEPLTGMEFLLS